MDLYDTLTLDGPRRTGDGYLVADVRAARTGIQEYRGYEVGRPDLDVVRVYRPEDEVFATDALKSFAWRPVTLGHPKDAVTADNWRKLAVGQVGDEVKRDGDFVRVPLVLMDAAAIREVEAGTKQLSMGYSAELIWGDGVTPSGETYNATQTGIRANHLAVVTVARGGPALAIGDQNRGKDPDMTLKTIMVDGIQCEVTDVSAAIIQRHLSAMQGQIDKLNEKLKEAEGDAKKAKDAAAAETAKLATEGKAALDAKDAEIATLKKQLDESKITPAHLDALAKDRGDAVLKAKAVVGDKLVVDGKTTAEIKRQAVDAYLGDMAKDYTDAQVDVAFATMTAKSTAAGADPVRDAGRRSGGFAVQNADERSKAFDEQGAYLREAWKGETATRQ